MAIKHSTTKAPGNTLPAADWNADHITDYPDTLNAPGRKYSQPGWHTYNMGTGGTQVGRMWYMPIFVSKTITYDRIGIYLTGAAPANSLARLGIYEWNNGTPGDLVLDAGTVLIDSIWGKEIVINQQLERGYYFLALVSDGSATCLTPDRSRVGCPVDGKESGISGGFQHIIPYVDGEVGQVAGGLTDPAVAPTATGAVITAFHVLREV